MKIRKFWEIKPVTKIKKSKKKYNRKKANKDWRSYEDSDRVRE